MLSGVLEAEGRLSRVRYPPTPPYPDSGARVLLWCANLSRTVFVLTLTAGSFEERVARSVAKEL